ncbi:hypothetical protein GCM10007972_00070 [Iodidimonas muriae]|uniref:Uncharacterized protein n=1 Tax=Iodidimonas muriae TaxID=261467 RepID=A0ABQ2L5R1_9PROT|nr:hypothetical protein [Iodidimonas muriae]GER06264.1 hypothetical protein JCM17843_05740 [Kordiimonadales bacterium JCM 17843]GGO04057.1 hypothetical protein GCM10007972_00070 [Iodidimonas muriae]
MTAHTSLKTAASVIVLAVAGLAIWQGMLDPSRILPMAVAALFLPIAGGGALLLVHLKCADATRRSAALASLYKGIIFGGIILAVSLAATLGALLGAFDGAANISKRISGIIIGAVFLYYANSLPKRVASAKMQKILRGNGWIFVIAGLGYFLSWLALPIQMAGTVAIGIMAVGVAVVIIRTLGYRRACQPSNEGQ